jgi:hypothetical protein
MFRSYPDKLRCRCMADSPVWIAGRMIWVMAGQAQAQHSQAVRWMTTSSNSQERHSSHSSSIAVLLTPVVFPEVGKQIGQGAYATVAFGLHKESSKKVAIKIYDAWSTWFLVRPYCCQQFKAIGGWLWLCMTMYDLQISVGFMTFMVPESWCSPADRCLFFCLVAQEKYKLLDPQRRKSVRCEIRPLGQKLKLD